MHESLIFFCPDLECRTKENTQLPDEKNELRKRKLVLIIACTEALKKQGYHFAHKCHIG